MIGQRNPESERNIHIVLCIAENIGYVAEEQIKQAEATNNTPISFSHNDPVVHARGLAPSQLRTVAVGGLQNPFVETVIGSDDEVESPSRDRNEQGSDCHCVEKMVEESDFGRVVRAFEEKVIESYVFVRNAYRRSLDGWGNGYLSVGKAVEMKDFLSEEARRHLVQHQGI